MLFSLLFSNPLAFLLVAVALIAAITIHEFAHAWMADRLGDPTPRYQDRVTLNPLAHLDPVGTLAILFVGFGWGKPVMFDPYNLKDPVRDAALISLAGPASNLILAVILAAISGLLPLPALLGMSSILVATIIEFMIYINVMLAIFNLIPIHPLDGGKIAVAILPKDIALEYDQFMRQYGTLVLLALIVPWAGRSPASMLISPIIDVVANMILSIF